MRKYMNVWKEKLLGELVGLARATDGNEHLITEPVTLIIAEILCANVLSEAQYAEYTAKIDAAKQEMVPDCFHCANPCGRTAALDLKTLDEESQQVKQAKISILDEIRNLAGSERSHEMDLMLYRGLVILGLEGYSAEELTALFTDV